MGYEKPLTGAQRVAKRRAALRAQGLKPRTFWLPDVHSEAFREAAARACAAINKASKDAETEAWIAAMIDEVLVDYPAPEGYD